jgi:diacylglycerol kinase (ATP)
MAGKKFSLKKRLKSFRYAFNGLKILLAEEHNARIHLVAAVIVIIAGFFFHLSRLEWIAVCFAIGIVFITELLNSSIEALSDHNTTAFHPFIKKTKDLAAGAVLIAAIIAVVTGLIVFVPHVLLFF